MEDNKADKVLSTKRWKTLPAGSTPGIRVLCPTRWTVCAQSIHSIMAYYETLEKTWEEALQATQDTEAKARIQRVAAQMREFTFFSDPCSRCSFPPFPRAANI